MNRYESSQRWRKEDTGVYSSPCGHYRAFKEGPSRWQLVEFKDLVTYGPFVALADCQEHAERLQNPLGSFR